MMKNNYIVFDVETGGLDPNKTPITQYSAVVLDGITLKELDRYDTYIKPYGDLKINMDVLSRTMVTMSDINSGITLKDFVSTVTEFWELYQVKTRERSAGRLVPVGHNVPFDIGFVNKALEISNIGEDIYHWIFPNIVDTMVLAKMMWAVKGDEKLNLGSCCERVGISLVDAHGSMNDVEATADLFRHYVKKLRSSGGSSSGVGEVRKRGVEFFEFMCGAK